MSLSAISGFFVQSVPIGVVFLVVYLVRIGWKIGYINEKLDNHVTDTNKKIDALKNDMNVLRSDMNVLRNDMNARMDRIETKLDRLMDHLIKSKS